MINGHVNGRYLDDKFFWPVFECAEALGVPIYLHPQIPPKPVVDAYYGGFAPEVSAFLSIAGSVGTSTMGTLHPLNPGRGVRPVSCAANHCGPSPRNIELDGVADGLRISVKKEGGLKRTIKEYLRENFYGGILAGEYVGQEPGAMDKSWSLSYQAYLGMANTVGIDRVVFTTD